MIPSPVFSTFGAGFVAIFAAYLRKPGISFDKFSTIDKSVCRIAESVSKSRATFDKYAGKPVVKPLSKPQGEGKMIWH